MNLATIQEFLSKLIGKSGHKFVFNIGSTIHQTTQIIALDKESVHRLLPSDSKPPPDQ